MPSYRPTRRTVLRAATAAALVLPMGLAAGGSAAARSASSADPVSDLGEPVHKIQDLSSAIGPGADGQPQGYYFVEGNPNTTGEFAVVDLRTGQTVLDVRIPSGTSSARAMDVSPVDGTVYFGTADTGDLYRYRPGATDVEHLGVPVPGEVFWELDVDSEGTVWGGTYPGGRVFSYAPATGEVHDYGQALDGETYVEALEQAGGAMYAGTSPHGKLARLDPASGTFTEVPFPDGHDATDVTELDLRGGLLFVTTDKLYVLDTATGSWVDQQADITGRGVSPADPADPKTVYYHSATGPVVRYHLDTRATEQTAWAPTNAAPEAWGWIDLADPGMPGASLAFTYYNHGRTYAYNFTTAASYYREPTLMGSGDQIITMAAGPDGNIYSGAYLTPPGMGRWDPDKAAFELLADSGQVEGFGSFRGDLVYGRYPQGALYRYDLDQPWSQGTNPAPPATIGNEQNRPQSFAVLGGTVAVTSVPETGRHGGAVTLWDPATDQLDVHRNVVENQTPVSLAVRDGLLYGGTSINGGYGVDPVTPEGSLFVWDPSAAATVFRTAPVPGAANVSGLVFDADGLLWGLGDSTLFAFDPRTRRVTRTLRLFDDTDTSRYGNDRALLLDHGRLFGVTANRVFWVDPVTEQVQVLHDGSGSTGPVHNLAADRNGDLYFIARATHLYRYHLPSDTTPPTVRATVLPGPHPVVRLSAKDRETGVSAVLYRIDSGPWTAYQRPFGVPHRGPHTVEYRAVDEAFNASQVGRVRVHG